MAKCEGYNFNFFATNSNSASLPVSVIIKTDKGEIIALGDKVIVDGEVKTFGSANKYYGKVCYGIGHEIAIKEFYDCIKEGRKFAVDGEEASKVIKMILATYSSSGTEVKL
jgi:predicted dehydrogenase